MKMLRMTNPVKQLEKKRAFTQRVHMILIWNELNVSKIVFSFWKAMQRLHYNVYHGKKFFDNSYFSEIFGFMD